MEFHLILAFFNLSQLVSIKGDLKYELITWVDWTNQNNVEIRYPKLNFNSLLKFNFGYRISTLFQSSHIRSLLIVKQSLLNFKLIRFSWYEHNTYICIYIYIYCIYTYIYIYIYIMWSNTWCLFYLHEIRNDRAISLFLSVDPLQYFLSVFFYVSSVIGWVQGFFRNWDAYEYQINR